MTTLDREGPWSTGRAGAPERRRRCRAGPSSERRAGDGFRTGGSARWLPWSAPGRAPRPEAPITSLDFSFATHDDVDPIVELVERAYRGDSSRTGWTTEADLLDGQRTDPAMIRDALARPGAHLLVAHRDDRLVACCELQRPPQGGKGAAYFGMFSVDPALQGSGVGRRVLAEAERIAAGEWSATAMELTVIEQRPELIDWYERRGYARTGSYKPFPYGDERFGRPRRDDLRLAVLTRSLG